MTWFEFSLEVWSNSNSKNEINASEGQLAGMEFLILAFPMSL